MQLHESAVAQSPSQPNYEGARCWLGLPERRGGALVAPSLEQYVAGQISHATAIEKERRKAREARADLHNPPAGGKKPPNGKGPPPAGDGS